MIEVKDTPVDLQITNKIQNDFRNLDTEYTLMAYYLKKDPKGIKAARREWFSDKCLRAVFDVLNDSRATLKPQVLFEEMKQRKLLRNGDAEVMKPALRNLYSQKVASVDDRAAKVMLRQIMRLANSRRILEATGKLVLDMENFDLDKSLTRLKELAVPMTLNDDHGGDYLETYPDRLDELEEKKARAKDREDGEVGILTGIPRFDQITGGMMHGEFGVVAGRTGIGKTAFLIHLAITAWNAGRNVMLVSGEQSRNELGFRVDSYLSKISATKFRKSELDKEDYTRWDRTIKEKSNSHENTLWVASFMRKFDVEMIRGEMIRMEEETGNRVDLLCIDYLNLMQSSTAKDGDNSREWGSQADVVWQVKELTAEYQIATWTAGQVRDEAYLKEVYTADDLKYARAISETAPVIVALIQTDEDEAAKRMKLQVLKMRNAETFRKPIILHPNMDILMVHDEELRSATKSLSDDNSDVLEMETTPRGKNRRSNYKHLG